MRKTIAKVLQQYAKRNRLVPADYRRLKTEWNRTPTPQRAAMRQAVEKG